MWLLSNLRTVRMIRSRANWTREQILAHQRNRLGELLSFVWKESPFYREYYSSHGISEKQLLDVSVSDLPVITKEVLMESFDRVSKDPLLTRARIEAWIASDAAPGLYENRYVIVHTSGTSGTMGLIAYDKSAWSRFRGVATVRSGTQYRFNPLRRDRIAFCGAVHGRFAGVTSIITAPSLVVKTLLCSVLDPLEKNIDRLNEFQPEHLVGYPSVLKELAESTLVGKLNIKPRFVLSSGEVLTPGAAQVIEKAWMHKPLNSYAASESLCIGVSRQGGSGMSLMEDEHIVEMLDDRDAPVAPGQVGRVVLTSLYNRTTPIIRYNMRDYVTRGYRAEGERFEPILSVDGRSNDALPIRSADGQLNSIHPIVLSEFFVPGVQKIQFVSHSTDQVSILYLATEDKDDEVQREFRRILDLRGAASSIRVSTTRVSELAADDRTGKYKLVVCHS